MQQEEGNKERNRTKQRLKQPETVLYYDQKKESKKERTKKLKTQTRVNKERKKQNNSSRNEEINIQTKKQAHTSVCHNISPRF